MRLAAELSIDRRGCPAGERDCQRVAARRPRCPDGSLHRSLRYHRQNSCQPSQVTRQHRQVEVLADQFDAAIHGLSNPADIIAPTDVLFDAFASHLADAAARVSRDAAIDRAAALMRVMARDVWRYLALTTAPRKVTHVVALVGAERLGMTTGHAIERAPRIGAFGEAVRMAHDGADDQARTVLHQDVTVVAQDGRRAFALLEQPGVRSVLDSCVSLLHRLPLQSVSPLRSPPAGGSSKPSLGPKL